VSRCDPGFVTDYTYTSPVICSTIPIGGCQ
jgi:hypothetical protein